MKAIRGNRRVNGLHRFSLAAALVLSVLFAFPGMNRADAFWGNPCMAGPAAILKCYGVVPGVCEVNKHPQYLEVVEKMNNVRALFQLTRGAELEDAFKNFVEMFFNELLKLLFGMFTGELSLPEPSNDMPRPVYEMTYDDVIGNNLGNTGGFGGGSRDIGGPGESYVPGGGSGPGPRTGGGAGGGGIWPGTGSPKTPNAGFTGNMRERPKRAPTTPLGTTAENLPFVNEQNGRRAAVNGMFIKSFSVQSLQVESMRHMVRDVMSVETFRALVLSIRPSEEEEAYMEFLTKSVRTLSKNTKERLDILKALGFGENELEVWRTILELTDMRDEQLAITNVLTDILTMKNNELAFFENMLARAQGSLYGNEIQFWDDNEAYWNLFGKEGDDLDME